MKNDARVLNALIQRGLKIFLTDKAGVFFSLLAPLIILFLYVLFLADVQVSSIEAVLDEFGVVLDSDTLGSYVDGWMLAGVMAVSSITVSFSAQGLMIQDRERGVIADMLASPVKRGVLSLSYLFYNFAVTLIICGVVLVVAFIYLAIAGWTLSVGHTFSIIGITILSVLSASIFSTLVCGAMRTSNVHSAVVGIMSAAIGFLIGAYMPMSTFPKAIQYIVLFIPGTYSAGVYRNLFTSGASELIGEASPQALVGIREGFSMEMDFFGKTIGEQEMWWIFAITIVIFISLYVVVQVVKAKRGTLFSVEGHYKHNHKNPFEKKK